MVAPLLVRNHVLIQLLRICVEIFGTVNFESDQIAVVCNISLAANGEIPAATAVVLNSADHVMAVHCVLSMIVTNARSVTVHNIANVASDVERVQHTEGKAYAKKPENSGRSVHAVMGCKYVQNATNDRLLQTVFAFVVMTILYQLQQTVPKLLVYVLTSLRSDLI